LIAQEYDLSDEGKDVFLYSLKDLTRPIHHEQATPSSTGLAGMTNTRTL